ncbi:MAG: transglycosylase SLT domain-containing protein [Spirochaetaceae bacterium]|nr:transglycosylase SLT domain-containing protein [Spirochaetaceae bacterium]
MKKLFFLLFLSLCVFAFAQEAEPLSDTEPVIEKAAEPVVSDESASETENTVVAEQVAQEQPAEEENLILLSDIGIPFPADNARFLRFYEQYTSDYGKKWLAAVMENGKPYRSYIQKKIAEYGLPECFEFLPVIESNFNINATSKSGATGLWQFMKNSIAPYNIRVNEWFDERRDPWLSTDAAIRKLKENYDVLGDWCLALAAYNTGLGGISRIVKKNGTNDYWLLSEKKLLKTETLNYVPKFLAIAQILTNAEKYGILIQTEETEEETEPEQYTVIKTTRNMDLGVIAELAEIDNKLISFLNPALFYGVTPPGISYGLRVPAAAEDKVNEIIADKNLLLVKYHRYKIKSRDTLYALAKHYSVSVDMILQANPGISAETLQIGKTLLIPALKDVSPYAGKKNAEKIAYEGVHIVEQGETLWGLSLKYNVQVESLAEENNMDVNAILRIGSKLKVPIIK